MNNEYAFVQPTAKSCSKLSEDPREAESAVDGGRVETGKVAADVEVGFSHIVQYDFETD